MVLDINSPADSVQIADLPRYIRETRAAITTTGVYGASFETGVLTGDAVYLDSVNNVWRRSLAGDPTRGKFHGFADIDQGLVVIWGFFTSQAWAFADGATIYVSGSDLGALTDADTGIAVGVCIAGDTILIDSQISSSFTALRDEIAAARDGAVDLHTKLETMDAARGVVADEITAARGGAATLANRLSLIDSSIGTVTEEVEVSRGDAATLGQRLDVSLNPDGSLKTTTSVSNFATESAAILYVNSTTFTVAGDKTAIYVANRTIRCNSSSALIGYVSSSSYDGGTGLTTVVVTGVTVPVSLSTIEYSFHPNEMPRMAHSGLTGILGADPSSSDVTTNKHVSNNQLKVLTDGKQPLDATLTALAGLATSANKIVLATGADAFSMIPFNSPAQSIGAAADVAAVRGVLGLGDAAVKNVGTGSGDVSAGNHEHSGVYLPLTDVTDFAKTILDDANAAAARTTLGCDVQRTKFADIAAGTYNMVASEAGKTFWCAGGANIILPQIGTLAGNEVFEFIAYGAVTITVYNTGTDKIYNGTTNSTSITLANSERVKLLYIGGGSLRFIIINSNVANLVQLNASGQLPAVDGSLLTGISSLPTGCVIAVASETVPTGYLECNGAAISRTTYATLYASIGIIHGQGNGSTTFNIPDYRGRFLRGWAHGSTLDPDRASRTAMATGGQTGDHVGSVQADEFKAHTHNIFGNNASSEYGEVHLDARTGWVKATSSTGGNETRPTNANVMFCIKY